MLEGWLEGRAGALERGTARVEESLDAYVAAGNRLEPAALPHPARRTCASSPATGAARSISWTRARSTSPRPARASRSPSCSASGLARCMAGDNPDPDAATAAYERSVAVAREQNARLLELRAATRLAAHQLALGETPPGLGRVAELCDWFAPSPDLPDVVRARALVEAAP